MDSEDAAELDYMCEVDFLQTRLRVAGTPVDPIMAERILVNIQSTARLSVRLEKWKKRITSLQRLVDGIEPVIPVAECPTHSAIPASQFPEARGSSDRSARDQRGQTHSSRNYADRTTSPESSPSPAYGERGRKRKRSVHQTRPKRGRDHLQVAPSSIE